MKYLMAFLLLFASYNAQAELHKWVDSDGNVHYSDIAPTGNTNNSETLNMQGYSSQNSAASGAAPAKSIFEQEAEVNKERKAKEEAAQKAAKEQQNADTKKQNCEQARTQMETLKNSPRLATYDANGQPGIMSDAERQQAKDRAQEAIDKYCD